MNGPCPLCGTMTTGGHAYLVPVPAIVVDLKQRVRYEVVPGVSWTVSGLLSGDDGSNIRSPTQRSTKAPDAR